MAELINRIEQSGFVSAQDVLGLRQHFYKDGAIDRGEALAIWSLSDTTPDGDPEWTRFFLEALTTYFVEQSHPRGHVDDTQAEMLIGRIGIDVSMMSNLAFDLLVQIMAKAASAPPRLSAFALDAIRHTVLNGSGPTAHGHSAPGVITKSDVACVRKVLYAAAGDDHLGISHREAELLFELNDATIESRNDPEWSDLFVKAIACYLMAHMGYRPPSREEALRRSAWLDDTSTNVGSFLSRMATGGLDGFKDLFVKKPPRLDPNLERDVAVAAAEEITADETEWLSKRIARDGLVHENERALIAYMKTLGAELPPVLLARIQSLEHAK